MQRLAAEAASLEELAARVSVCRACPRLVRWREEIAVTKRRAFADEPYWGRPVPGWGPADAAVLVVGLAPAAHGGNRTGRVFTGDRSGDVLFAALHRVGLAALPTSTRAEDGQRLLGTRVLAAVRCAPPGNHPTPVERDTCAPWLDAELRFLSPTVRSVVALGAFAWQACLSALRRAGTTLPVPKPAFAHAAEVALPGPVGYGADLLLVGCFHPSQQNAFTGRLTASMVEAVLRRAAAHAGLSAGGGMPA